MFSIAAITLQNETYSFKIQALLREYCARENWKIPENWEAYFYRTNAGAEIDLLLFDDKNKLIAVEIKYSASPKVKRGFWNACEDISCKKGFVVLGAFQFFCVSRDVNLIQC